MTLLLLLALGCDTRPAQFACGKVICAKDEICLHWDVAEDAPPDDGHGCVEAPAACGDVPTCDCAADVCLSDCDDAGDGVSCWGEAP